MNPDIYLNRATEQIHVAAQYLAMIGKYYVAPKDDDSHTNMGWDLTTKQFSSHGFSDQQMKLFLRPGDLRLGIGTDAMNIEAQQDLNGLSQKEGSEWVRSQLARLDLDPDSFQISLHYDMPAYGDFEDQTFEILDDRSYRLFSEMRGWAKEILVQYKNQFSTAEDDRTWPHHFDHGCYVPLIKDKTGQVISSISFGLAIHDGLQSSHYLYVTHWATERSNALKLPKLSAGRWEMERMHGALLPISVQGDGDFDVQTSAAHTFVREAIDASLIFLKATSK